MHSLTEYSFSNRDGSWTCLCVGRLTDDSFIAPNITGLIWEREENRWRKKTVHWWQKGKRERDEQQNATKNISNECGMNRWTSIGHYKWSKLCCRWCCYSTSTFCTVIILFIMRFWRTISGFESLYFVLTIACFVCFGVSYLMVAQINQLSSNIFIMQM